MYIYIFLGDILVFQVVKMSFLPQKKKKKFVKMSNNYQNFKIIIIIDIEK